MKTTVTNIHLLSARDKFAQIHRVNSRLIGKNLYDMLGFTTSLTKEEMDILFCKVGAEAKQGDEAIFDYTDSISYSEIRAILSKNGFSIYEHLTPYQIKKQLLPSFDTEIKVYFCLAVKKEM